MVSTAQHSDEKNFEELVRQCEQASADIRLAGIVPLTLYTLAAIMAVLSVVHDKPKTWAFSVFAAFAGAVVTVAPHIGKRATAQSLQCSFERTEKDMGMLAAREILLAYPRARWLMEQYPPAPHPCPKVSFDE